MSMSAAIVRIARSKVGSKDWLCATEKGNFGKNTNKCNQFVYDVLVEAGVKPPPVVPKYVVLARPPPQENGRIRRCKSRAGK